MKKFKVRIKVEEELIYEVEAESLGEIEENWNDLIFGADLEPIDSEKRYEYLEGVEVGG